MPDHVLMDQGGDKLARGCIPKLGGFVHACRQDPSAVRTKRRVLNGVLMDNGGYGFARRRIPEIGTLIFGACRQDPSAVRTKRRVKVVSRRIPWPVQKHPSAVWAERPVKGPTQMVKGNDQLARGHIPKVDGIIRACRQDADSVRTKRRVLNRILMDKRDYGLPEAASQSLAVLSLPAVRIRVLSALNAARKASS